ncbi:MAG: class II fructose-bisphosphate aldolase [Candidatus Brocadiia bacterium]
MPIVTDPAETRRLLDTFRKRRVALPCFCTENPWTTEAALAATAAAGERCGLANPPVSISFCGAYPMRTHLINYWFCDAPRLGFQALMADLKALMRADGPYGHCRVFPMLDHGQPEEDRWLLEDQLDGLAMVMFDASHWVFEENVRRTAGYVERFGERIVVEGAVAELKEAARAGDAFPMTTPEQARRFLEQTGCDLIVPNVGTEHRAAETGLAEYHPERARRISQAVGPRLVLHGTSCMGDAGLRSVPGDGFVKVNVWTIIEKTGAEAMVDYALRQVGNLVEQDFADGLVAEGLLAEEAVSAERVERQFGGRVGPKLSHFPLAELRDRWVGRVKGVLEGYFDMFGYARLAGG